MILVGDIKCCVSFLMKLEKCGLTFVQYIVCTPYPLTKIRYYGHITVVEIGSYYNTRRISFNRHFKAASKAYLTRIGDRG